MRHLYDSPPDVLLINMPFGPLMTPSLGLSLIKSLLTSARISSAVSYLNVDFAEVIGYEIYHYIACGLPRAHDLVGEFIFSRALFGSSARSTEEYIAYLSHLLTDVRKSRSLPATKKLLNDLEDNLERYRCAADQYIDLLTETILHSPPRVLAFTSAFQQNTASLALAKRVKEHNASIQVIFGGANFEDSMGRRLFNEFHFIDCVIFGEAESVAVHAVDYLLKNISAPPTGNVVFRSPSDCFTSRKPLTGMIADMDAVPFPDFDDFVACVSGRELPEKPRLLFETSRGCWWGEKHHCKFCGLNGGTMKFRRKDPFLAFQQLMDLVNKYPQYDVCMTDNIIDNKYLTEFVPLLIDVDHEFHLFYETKANIKKEHLILLSKAGIKRIQPGIESFSDSILSLMNKGVTGLQNIQLLKWCREVGIEAEWNFLWGFPGEQLEEYRKMAQIIPRITHLKPPAGVGSLRLDRFSPYWHEASMYFDNVKPFPAYYIVYPLEEKAIRDIAYFFDGELKTGVDPNKYTSKIRRRLEMWKHSNESVFTYVDMGDHVILVDARDTTKNSCDLTVLVGLEKEILLHGEKVRSIKNFVQNIGEKERGLLHDVLTRMAKNSWIIVDKDKYLSLPVKSSKDYPGKDFWNRVDLNSRKANKVVYDKIGT